MFKNELDLLRKRNIFNYIERINKLKALKLSIINNTDLINDALFLDLSKDSTESYITEISHVITEINYLIKNLKKLMKPKRVKTPLTLKFAKSYLVNEPLGVVLVISPWNYPLLLSLNPLVGAISAGNKVVLKPSEFTPNTNKVITNIINEVFEKDEVVIYEGDAKATSELLDNSFDLIFFTGSTNVGKIIMEKASKNLTPVILELGGKSPVVVYDDFDIKLAAKKVVFAKLINAGQTCIAPDYLMIKKGYLEVFVKWFEYYVDKFYGDDILNNESYPKIINENHINRLTNLYKDEEVIYGGKYSGNKIEPTLINIKDNNSKIMEEEIFGSILPIITFEDDLEPINYINTKEKPLVIYTFTNDKKIKNKYINNTSSGTLVFNDCLVQFANVNLPFGGVGHSGMGKYHGKESFNAFSHEKAIMDKKRYLDLNVKYHPYTKKKEKILKKFLK